MSPELEQIYADLYGKLPTMSPDEMRALAVSYKFLATVDPEPTVQNLEVGIAALFTYLAELLSPCAPDDLSCIEHKRKNCQCLDAETEVTRG